MNSPQVKAAILVLEKIIPEVSKIAILEAAHFKILEKTPSLGHIYTSLGLLLPALESARLRSNRFNVYMITAANPGQSAW